MRTAQRDQARLTTFGAITNDAASGGGIAQPGAIPYSFTRAGTGVYNFSFDTALTPMGVLTSPRNVTTARCSTNGPGTMQIIVEQPAGTAANGGIWGWQITALDGRR